jgi:serine/threonine protein kinase
MPTYRLIDKIGQGAFGKVYRAKYDDDDNYVAIKCTEIDANEGIPCTTLREIAILKDIDHPNIVQILDVYVDDHHVNIVFELCTCNLREELDARHPLRPEDIVHYFRQLMSGISVCHFMNILHRDIKPHNILVDRKTRTLKLADFGLTRGSVCPNKAYTHEVVTLWYRCPEILLGVDIYDAAIDIWSCGCVLAQMCTNQPIFCGDSEIGMIFAIFQLLGTPTNMNHLQHFNTKFPRWEKKDLTALFLNIGQSGVDLLERMFDYDPATRITGEKSLCHAYLKTTKEGVS